MVWILVQYTYTHMQSFSGVECSSWFIVLWCSLFMDWSVEPCPDSLVYLLKKMSFPMYFPLQNALNMLAPLFPMYLCHPNLSHTQIASCPAIIHRQPHRPCWSALFLWGIYWTFAKSKGGWVTNRWMLFACKHTLTRWCQINPNHYLNGKYWGDQIFPGNVRVSNQAETVIWYYRNPEFIKEQLYVLNQPNLWCPYEFVSCAYYILMLSL